jgi:hypothetical protein
MKKVVLGVAVAFALLVWVASWFRVPEAVVASAGRAWPGGMGTLEAVKQRFSPRTGNAAAGRLTALANALPKSDAIEQYVAREVTRGELTIGEAPALPDVTAIRELLLREEIQWERVTGIGGGDDMNARRVVQLTIARTLVASALAKGRANDAAAWEELHAAWKLARSLEEHPQLMVRTAGLTTARLINAVAWKMPLPAPPWLADLQARDHVRPLLEAFQYSAASYGEDGLQLFPTKMLANSVDHDRAIAEALFRETRCDVNAQENELGTDLRFIWRRAFRYRAEREATANALRVREGQPIATRSTCSDGAWTFDGTTLRFSREIATEPPDTPMPLVLRPMP